MRIGACDSFNSNASQSSLSSLRSLRPLQQQWARNTPACQLCERRFTVFARPHHCRTCARCVCNTCSPNKIELDGRLQRVCKACVESEIGGEHEPLLKRPDGDRVHLANKIKEMHAFANLQNQKIASLNMQLGKKTSEIEELKKQIQKASQDMPTSISRSGGDQGSGSSTNPSGVGDEESNSGDASANPFSASPAGEEGTNPFAGSANPFSSTDQESNPLDDVDDRARRLTNPFDEEAVGNPFAVGDDTLRRRIHTLEAIATVIAKEGKSIFVGALIPDGADSVVKAWYGREDELWGDSGCDATEKVKELLRIDRSLNVSNANFGDPCPRRSKALAIQVQALVPPQIEFQWMFADAVAVIGGKDMAVKDPLGRHWSKVFSPQALAEHIEQCIQAKPKEDGRPIRIRSCLKDDGNGVFIKEFSAPEEARRWLRSVETRRLSDRLDSALSEQNLDDYGLGDSQIDTLNRSFLKPPQDPLFHTITDVQENIEVDDSHFGIADDQLSVAATRSFIMDSVHEEVLHEQVENVAKRLRKLLELVGDTAGREVPVFEENDASACQGIVKALEAAFAQLVQAAWDGSMDATSSNEVMTSENSKAALEIDSNSLCNVCESKLGKRYFNPKHECTNCRKLVCGSCSPSIIKDSELRDLQRVCSICVKRAFGGRRN
mmetsp:Transcript_114423/g.180157  ORF Transcript_114423/g.180157 Transcript_114423/m.180157 type:complete len:665 (-) Transcript_114423:68-2062(-)